MVLHVLQARALRDVYLLLSHPENCKIMIKNHSWEVYHLCGILREAMQQLTSNEGDTEIPKDVSCEDTDAAEVCQAVLDIFAKVHEAAVTHADTDQRACTLFEVSLVKAQFFGVGEVAVDAVALGAPLFRLLRKQLCVQQAASSSTSPTFDTSNDVDDNADGHPNALNFAARQSLLHIAFVLSDVMLDDFDSASSAAAERVGLTSKSVSNAAEKATPSTAQTRTAALPMTHEKLRHLGYSYSAMVDDIVAVLRTIDMDDQDEDGTRGVCHDYAGFFYSPELVSLRIALGCTEYYAMSLLQSHIGAGSISGSGGAHSNVNIDAAQFAFAKDLPALLKLTASSLRASARQQPTVSRRQSRARAPSSGAQDQWTLQIAWWFLRVLQIAESFHDPPNARADLFPMTDLQDLARWFIVSTRHGDSLLAYFQHIYESRLEDMDVVERANEAGVHPRVAKFLEQACSDRDALGKVSLRALASLRDPVITCRRCVAQSRINFLQWRTLMTSPGMSMEDVRSEHALYWRDHYDVLYEQTSAQLAHDIKVRCACAHIHCMRSRFI